MDYPKAVTAAGLCLLCRVGALTCALQLEAVAETMRPLPISSLAGAPPFVIGLAVIRGVPTPVVDASRLLNGTASIQPLRFVRLLIPGRSVALAVDEVIGIRDLSAQSFEALPPVLAACADIAPQVATLDTELLVVLSTARLVPEAVWLTLNEGVAS